MKKAIQVSISDKHVISIEPFDDAVGFKTDEGDTVLLEKRTLERGLAILKENK